MSSKLAAFKVSRRSIAVAVFSGQMLDYVDTTHLSNDPELAKGTLFRIIGWVIENFHPEMAAVGLDEDDRQPRASLLTMAAKEHLLRQGTPVWNVTDEDLLKSYGIPALTQKHDLRLIAKSMWPHLPEKDLSALDAALAGLYVQTERLLSFTAESQ
jgi:hypothetical protein